MNEDQPVDIAIEIDRSQELHQRDQDRLIGDEHPEQHQREQDVRPPKPPLGQHIAVERTEDGRQGCRRNHQAQTVEEVRRKLIQRFGEAGRVQRLRKLPHRPQVDLIQALEAGDDHHVNRD